MRGRRVRRGAGGRRRVLRVDDREERQAVRQGGPAVREGVKG